MTLATAGARGEPWVSPVFYAPFEDRELYWVSDPAALHSRNIELCPQVAAVIFDSRVSPGEAQAVYFSGRAEELAGDALTRGIGIYSDVSVERGASAWTMDDVSAPALHRLYRLRAESCSVLDAVGSPQPGDRRIPVRLW
jgi:hypothetical protein